MCVTMDLFPINVAIDNSNRGLIVHGVLESYPLAHGLCDESFEFLGESAVDGIDLIVQILVALAKFNGGVIALVLCNGYNNQRRGKI
jgi:hypothetical protein